MKKITKKQSNEMIEILRKTYPDAKCSLDFTTPFQMVVAVMLSAQCTDERVNKVTPTLFEKCKTIEDFANIDIKELESLVHSCGFDMEEAARIAQAMEFIESKPEKFASGISQGGTNVSGGQKQRLSIARAIAKHPKICLFDDSFSALDYKTDVTLRKALSEKLRDATVIIVAQRISTILHADKIIVLDEGRIAGIGRHEELLASCGAYQEIARSQLSEDELKGGRA